MNGKPNPGLLERLRRDTAGARSCVEYGCGDMRYIGALDHIPSRLGVDITVHDVYPPGTIFLLSDFVYMAAKADAGLYLDSLEHCHKDEGRYALQTGRHLHDTVIVFTPRGFWRQSAEPDNPHQEHLSGWDVEDFPADAGWSTEIITNIGAAPASIYAVWKR